MLEDPNGNDQEFVNNSAVGKSRKRISKKVAACLVVTVLLVVLIIVVSLLSTRSASNEPRTETDTDMLVVPKRSLTKHVRLSDNLRPVHYDLQMLPYLEGGNFTFEGSVEILMYCAEDTDEISLHSLDLEILKDSVKVDDKELAKELPVHHVIDDPSRQLLTITLGDATLIRGRNYTVFIRYSGLLNDKLKGFYRSSYEENGVQKWLASTQFQATDARRAFPCFDQPNMKSEFTVTLGRKETMSSLSNMQLGYTTDIPGKPGYKWDHYKRSVPMVTYLVAMVVSDFQHVVIRNERPRIAIWTRPSAVNQTRYASKTILQILESMEKYLGVPYALEKLDMIAIPDFLYGAMENWGLVTFRESTLLSDDSLSSAANRERVISVISHETAHNWFGNLVTMQWWSNMFLNEGLANYVEMLGVEQVQPELRVLDQSLATSALPVFAADALKTTNPIHVDVDHPQEINTVISYEKGSCILHMLHGFLGKETFRNGLSRYIRKLQYNNAVEDDLWQAMTEQASEDRLPLPATVKQIMDPWLLKEGFPVVTVVRDYATSAAELHQERFLLGQNQGSTANLWWIPLTYTKDFKSANTSWISDKESSIALGLSDVGENDWVIFNVDHFGLYRVNYDQTNWDLIHKQLMQDRRRISELNRAQIMDDSLHLALTGALSYPTALRLTEYLMEERDYIPWKAALNGLTYIDQMFHKTSAYAVFKKYMTALIQPLYERIGFTEAPGDDHLKIYLRNEAVTWACYFGVQECIGSAKELYAKWTRNPASLKLSPNLKQAIVCIAIREGDDAEWNFAFEKYKEADVATEKDALLAAMACSKDIRILRRLLDMSMNATSGIRKQDGVFVFRYVAENPAGMSVVFQYLREHWEQFNTYFPVDNRKYRILAALSDSFNTESQLTEFQQFRNANTFSPGLLLNVDQCIDRIKFNIDWMRKYFNPVEDWIENFSFGKIGKF